MQTILDALGKYPTPPKTWDPLDVRTKPFFNQIIRNALPSLSTTQRSKLLMHVGPLFGQQFRARFKNASQKDLVEIARDLQQNSQFKDVLRHYQTTLEQEIGVPLNQIDAGTMQLDNQPIDFGAHKLRARFLLPTKDTLRESVSQSLNDIVQADLFDFRTPNEELGSNNALYLGNLQNERLRFMDPTMPRGYSIEQLVSIAPVLPQWTGQFDVEDAIYDKIRDDVVQEGIKSLPPFSIALNDNTNMRDPYGNYRPNNFMEPVNSLGPGYQRDFTQGVEFRELDMIGFRPDYDPLRNPRERTRMGMLPIQTREEQLSQIYRQGFDSTFHTGFAVQPPYQGPIDLKGLQWMDI